MGCTSIRYLPGVEIDTSPPRIALPKASTATTADQARCPAVLTLAFGDDPTARWMYPEPAQYLESFPELVRAFGGKAFAAGTAHVLEGLQGAALWLPPGVEPDEEPLMELIGRSVAPSRRGEAFELFEQMGTYHPREPHWYLPLIGVDPAHQRKGYGSVLLRKALAECDRSRELAYLESSNPENIPLYQRHGFEALGEIRVGSSPPVTPMLRAPR